MEAKYRVQKKKIASVPWMIVFVIGFAVLYVIGQMQYQKQGISRPLWDWNINYMLFCNLPFHLGKTLGIASHDLKYNLWTMLASVFFLIVGMGLYFGEERDGSEIRQRLFHFLGAFWCFNLMCDAMASTSIAKVGSGSALIMYLYAGYLGVTLWILTRSHADGYAYLRFVCYQLSGICFALATAGFLRVVVNLNKITQFLVPLKTLPHIARLSFRLSGGLGHAVLALAILFALTFALVFLLTRIKKITGHYFIFFLYTGIIFFLFFLCSKSIKDNSYTNETIKYWVWILLSLAIWTCRLPKKKILFFVLGLAAYLLCYVVVMSHYIFFDVYRESIAAFVDKMPQIEAQLVENAAVIFANAKEPATAAKAMFVIGLLVLTIIAHFVHRFIVSKMTHTPMFPKDNYNKQKTRFMDYSDGHYSDWAQVWAVFILVGISVTCYDWDLLAMDVVGFLILLIGIYGFAFMMLNDALKKRTESLQSMLVMLPVLVILVPPYVLFGSWITALAFCVVLAVGFVSMGGGGSSGAAGAAGGGSDGGAQIDTGRQIINTMWMASSLNSIEKAVNSGQMNYHQGVFYSHLVVDKASELGVFGKGDQ